MDLLPCPRSVKRFSGFYELPKNGVLHLPADLPRDTYLLPLAERLKSAAAQAGSQLELVTGLKRHPRLVIQAELHSGARPRTEAYVMRIDFRGVSISCEAKEGLRAAVATLRQLLRQFGRRLPRLEIRDYPDFPRRGVMLDVSRGRVPKLETLLDLVDHLADFKVNEFQLYTENTFAYRNYEPVWHDWDALTGEDILRLDGHCRKLGIDLVPNQNSFGHLRYWLEYPPLRKLAETKEPYEGAGGTFLRYPATLAPNHPGTLPFLRELYDELLPHFTSRRFNVGCDETWDLGRGQSKRICEAKGKGRVYLEFLKQIHKEVTVRGRQMQFWGDIILYHPELIGELPDDAIALNWGYEANHPFGQEARNFARSKIPFYVCPGTSTWMTLVGRHDNAFANLRLAAEAGQRHGAAGYLNTDWGDGGHPQPLAVSWAPFVLGAALSWHTSPDKGREEKLLAPVLSREVFRDSTGRMARAAIALGLAHREFGYRQPNVTPFGAVIAAPIPRTREIPCRDGLKYYARIPEQNIRRALAELEVQRAVLSRATPETRSAEILSAELDLAVRMAAESCHIMLWQQSLAAGKATRAGQMAKRGILMLRELDEDFGDYWPLRNKGTTQKCSAFLRWRIEDYRSGALHFPPEEARIGAPPAM